MKEYLFYVRKFSVFKNDYALYIYKAKTKDPFHTIGEIVYRTIEHITRIDFVEATEQRLSYWASEEYDIYTWKDKYQKERE